MADISTNLPLTEASDAAEVSLALETARALWAKGQVLESVRWIQRAAENAESSGNDLRAVALARAAADLRAEVSVHSEPPPAAPKTDAAALAPYDDFTESTIVDSPASSLARVALQSSVQIAELQHAPPTQSSVIAAPTPTAPIARTGVAALHQAVRVCVVGGDAKQRELTIRILEEGERAPAGAAEALLVSLDSQAKLV
jgi:hypothetical protein